MKLLGWKMIKQILLLSIIFSIAHTDVNSRMKRTYKPMYNYSYSYSRLISISNYRLKYQEMRNEHKKVVRLLGNANKTIETLEYRIMRLEKNSKYWKDRATKKSNPTDKLKKKETIKKMRMNWKSN